MQISSQFNTGQGTGGCMLTDEELDDPDFLSEAELKQIEESLKDYFTGKYKCGSIDDLLRDLHAE